jgi:hypothetical protein
MALWSCQITLPKTIKWLVTKKRKRIYIAIWGSNQSAGMFQALSQNWEKKLLASLCPSVRPSA